MKTLKYAAIQFLSDIQVNRCLKLSYYDAVEGLSNYGRNMITFCYVLRDSRATAGYLMDLISSLLEYVIILHIEEGNDVRTVFKANHQDKALALFHSYIFSGKKASITAE
ncbi:hypothetical protein [Photorhabdus sp. RM71S]|uniref:hypothetical protein n=1 Tax=Photorhabdus sp. RM71S TaxID=3342824 RepID=UPI0036D8EB95